MTASIKRPVDPPRPLRIGDVVTHYEADGVKTFWLVEKTRADAVGLIIESKRIPPQ